MDLNKFFGIKDYTNEGTGKRKRRKKPGRPKGSVTVNAKKPRGLNSKEKAEAKKQFAFDWCYRNDFDLVGLANNQFIFRDRKKTWLIYEKPYDEETPYIPCETPVSHVKDY